jgi:hypothetical protein
MSVFSKQDKNKTKMSTWEQCRHEMFDVMRAALSLASNRRLVCEWLQLMALADRVDHVMTRMRTRQPVDIDLIADTADATTKLDEIKQTYASKVPTWMLLWNETEMESYRQSCNKMADACDNVLQVLYKIARLMKNQPKTDNTFFDNPSAICTGH